MGKSKTKVAIPPLAVGQIWQVEGLNLQVTRVGPMLVDYKLAKPDAVRVPNRTSAKSTIDQYLKRKKGVLTRG